MQLFFTQKQTQGNVGRIEAQQSALWVGLAMSLQALNEIGHDWFPAYLGKIGSLVPFLLYLGSFFVLWLALRPLSNHRESEARLRRPQIWQLAILLLTLVFAGRGIYEAWRGLEQSVRQPPQYWNDGTSLNVNGAYLLVEGRNPYTDSRLADLVKHFQIQPAWTTLLRVGRFAGRLDYPRQPEIQAAFEDALRSGDEREFETKISYPALSILPFVPFALLGQANVFPFYLFCYLLIIAIAWNVARPQLRPWAILLALANIPMWSSTVGGNNDILCFLFLILTWLLREKRWLSALCLGLACATKQTAWFFVPFYIVLSYRNSGLVETCKRLVIAGLVALAINLPFIVWNPQAWLTGVLTPLLDPMFPDGVGIISTSTAHILPYLPGWFYTSLESLALVAALWVYWRICRRRPEAAMLLAVLPLFFAWRSLPSYFACSAFAIFIVGVQRASGGAPSSAQ